MKKKVRNQAYKRLSRILDLPGRDFLGDVETGTAFPVHDLTPVVQSTLVVPWHFQRDRSPALGLNTYTLDVFDSSSWTEVFAGSQSGITEDVNPDTHDVLVTHMGLDDKAGGQVTDCQFYALMGTGSRRLLITNLLDTTGTYQMLAPASLPYYARPMPFRIPRWPGFTLQISITAGAATNVNYMLEALVGPRGVFEYGANPS